MRLIESREAGERMVMSKTVLVKYIVVTSLAYFFVATALLFYTLPFMFLSHTVETLKIL